MQTELRSRRSAPSKGITEWGVRHGLLDCEGRLHPLREMWYSLRIGEEADEGVLPRIEVDQDKVTFIAGRDGRRADEGHLPWQIGATCPQQIGRCVAGRETEHQHLV